MFTYYPEPTYYRCDFEPFVQRMQHSPGPRSDRYRPYTSKPRTQPPQREVRDKTAERGAESVCARKRAAPHNPTAFATYNPEALASFTSKELTTILGPSPSYIDGYAVYKLDGAINPRVRVLMGSEVHVTFAGDSVLRFRLPRGITAVDVEASLSGDTLIVRVPHCLSAEQECQVIDVIDGPLGDEYDEYGYYEGLCKEVYEKERAKFEQKRREEERRLYEQFLENQRQKKEALRRREEQIRRQNSYRYAQNRSMFEPVSRYPLCFNEPDLVRFLSM